MEARIEKRERGRGVKNFLRFVDVGGHSEKEIAINIAHICCVEKREDDVTEICTADGFRYHVRGSFEDILSLIGV